MAADDRPDPEDFFAFDDEDDWEDDLDGRAVSVGAGDECDEDEPEEGDAGGRPRTRSISSDPRRAPPAEALRSGPPAPGATCPWPSASASPSPRWPCSAFAARPEVRRRPRHRRGGRRRPLEFFNVLRQAGYQPASCSASPPCVALPLAAYYKGEAGIPVVLFLTVVFGLLWYLAGAGGDDRPVIGLSSTLLRRRLGRPPRARSPRSCSSCPTTRQTSASPGIGILLVAVLGTVGYDVGGFVVGRNAGTRPLSAASPNKTVEGLLGGDRRRRPRHGAGRPRSSPRSRGRLRRQLCSLGLCVAVAAPLGDLCESLVKRDLDVKDMGTILPGHGGFLDRFDALLFVLPVVYYLARILLY